METILIDTNILIGRVRREPKAMAALAAYEGAALALCDAVVAEVLAGARNRSEHDAMLRELDEHFEQLPLTRVKLDRSMIADVDANPRAAAIARSIVALANSLGLSVIAEGVETSAQREFLEQSGCLMYQGYLFSRPLLLAEFEHLLARPLDSSILQDKHP